MKKQEGFTLIELLVVISILGILFTLSAYSLRGYWLTQALEGASDDLVSQMRQVQQRTDSESAPLVYGVRLEEGTRNWAVIRYDPKSPSTPTDDECTQLTTYQFADGVTISAAEFDPPPNVTLSKCPQPLLDFAMFFARGTATDGTVTLTHSVTNKTRTINVLPLTGRVRVT